MGDEDTAHKIRSGHYTEEELIDMLEKENNDLAEFVHGKMTELNTYSDDGKMKLPPEMG